MATRKNKLIDNIAFIALEIYLWQRQDLQGCFHPKTEDNVKQMAYVQDPRCPKAQIAAYF